MSKVIIIAEAGVNHNGDINIAKKLVDAAHESGADYVKFQSFKTEKLVSKFAQKAQYQKETTGNNESQFEMIKKLELSEDDHVELIKYCENLGIGFLSSPFDVDGIGYLDSLNIDLFKIPSGEITNLPYLRELTKFNRPIVLSTGMANAKEVADALLVLKDKDVTVLHCNTEYPTRMKDVNLKAMLTIRDGLDVNVGYSDHTLGIEIPIAAVAMGAKVIEKHFTLDNTMEGPDHRASLEPNELKEMVTCIRNIEIALGNGEKVPSESEKKNIPIARKSIVALENIKTGDVFTEKNITVKRPGDGISPMRWDEVIGTKASKDFVEDELIMIE